MVWLKRGISLILLGVLIYFFWPLIGEFKAVGELIRSARWVWLGAAILVQVVSYAFLTWLNALALKPFSGKIGFVHLAFLLTTMAFIEIAIPSAGASGIAMRIRMLRKFGYTPEASLFSLAVETLSEAVALVSVAFLGVGYLLHSGRFTWLDVIWFIAAGGALGGVVWFLWRLLLDRERSLGFALKIAGWWNRFLGRFHRLNLDQVEVRVSAFRENLAHYRQVPFWKLTAAAYGKVLLDVATLGACFFIFHFSISPGTLLTGYGLILTFSSVAALPGGLGMTDAYVPVLFSWLAVPGSVALAAGLAYRLIAFWLVRFIGYIAWQFLENNGKSTMKAERTQ